MLTEKKAINEGDTEEEIKEHTLIVKSDCRACHNISKPTVGPSYMDIARRYENTEENIISLVNKVIKGGSGAWGEAAMTPHPDLSNSDATSIMRYILNLDKDEEKTSIALRRVSLEDYLKPDKIHEEKLRTGILTKMYLFNEQDIHGIIREVGTTDNYIDPIEKRILKRKRRPSYGGNIENIQIGQVGFGDLAEDFCATFEGFIKIDTSGTYVFRLASDDGSRLYIHDTIIINNDGLHDAGPKDGVVGLKKGLHPFKVVYFQGGGGRSIFLQWRKFEKSSL